MSKPSSLSSKKWIRRHIQDQYVIMAHKNNIRSRSYFKLDQIHSTIKLFKKGMQVVDLGSSPGGWSQYASEKVGKRGRIISCDMLPMMPIKAVSFIQGDIRNRSFLNFFLSHLNNTKIDLIMSDMSPNMSGFHCIDHCRFINLNKLVFKISKKILSNNGIVLVKSFHGSHFNILVKKFFDFFIKVKIFKPQASRTNSREVYIIAFGRKI